MNYRLLIASVAIVAAGSGCMAPKGGSAGEKRLYVNNMSEDTLTRLYAKKPEAKMRIDNAAGYGVFSQLETGTGIGGGGSGYGVVVNNETGSRSYMRMIQISGGIGFGLKSLRLIFLFHTHDALDKFVTEGGTQCGMCTPGMIMMALKLGKKPKLDEIRDGLAGRADDRL